MILREQVLKIINNHFQERIGLDYAVDDFEELILEEKKRTAELVCKDMILENVEEGILEWYAVDRYIKAQRRVKRDILNSNNERFNKKANQLK